MADYITTPELRLGPGPPYTSTSLQLNLFFRVFLGILANVCCWVPMRLLWKNGEFSAAVYCATVMVLNFFLVVNALIWRDNDVQNWFAGYGWCDLQIYTVFALQTLYSACIFAIMRNLATKVGMMRATSLTPTEKRRRILIEALIIFPCPLLQVVTTYFVLAQRYNVATLVGCTNMYYRTWLYLIVYHIPTNAFVILAVFFGILTWIRFRQVEKTTRTARSNTSSGMHQRHQRIRRKLYLMCLSIMVPFFPMQMFFLYANITAGLGHLRPYDYKKIHDPATFNMVTFATSQAMTFIEMNSSYVSVISVVPLFWYFGCTKEAVNTYRSYLLALGLGRWFPKLHEEYDPDRTRASNSHRSWGQHISGFLRSGTSRRSSSGVSRKSSILPSFQQVSIVTTTTSSSTCRDVDTIDEHPGVRLPAKGDLSPWPDVAVPEPAARHGGDRFPADSDGAAVRTQHRNPFIFRTMLAANPFHLPHMSIFSGSRGTDRSAASAAPPPPVALSDYGPSPDHHHPRTAQSGSTDTKSLVGFGTESRDGDGVAPWAAAVDSRRGTKGGAPKVRTRVWSDDEERQAAGAESWRSGVEGRKEDEESEIGVAVCGGSGVRVETRIARSEEGL